MNCSEAREKIPEYLAGLVPDPEDLLEHIRTCPACRREMELYRAIDMALSVPSTPPDLTRNIIREVRLVAGPRSSVEWDAVAWMSAALAGAMALAGVLLAYFPSINNFMGLVVSLAK